MENKVNEIEESKSELDEKLERESQTVKEWLEKPENIIYLTNYQDAFSKRFGDSWFNLQQVLKKTQLKNPKTAKSVLALMVQGEYLQTRLKNIPGVVENVFKVNKTEENLLTLKKLELEEVNLNITFLQNKRDALIKSIEEIENKSQIKLDL